MEVANHLLGSLLHCLVGDNIRLCDTCLSQVEFAHNSARNRSTCFCPFEVMYAFIPGGPIDLLALQTAQPPDARAEDIVCELYHVHQGMRARLTATNIGYKRRVDAHHRPLEFEVGDFV